MVHYPVMPRDLGVAGKFKGVYTQVISPFELGIYTEGFKGCNYGTGEYFVVAEFFGGILFNKGIVEVAEVMVDGSAAGHSPHDGDAEPPQGGDGRFPADILAASDDHGGGILPEQEDRIVPEILEDELLERLIIERVGRIMQDGYHGGASSPLHNYTSRRV